MNTIREAEPRDAAAIADVQAAADDGIHTAAGWLHDWRSAPERGRALSLVAEADGGVVGYARAGLDWGAAAATEGHVWIGVVPSYRGRGAGTALYERALVHVRAVGASRALSYSREDEPGPAWAERRGWRQTRAAIVVGVDPRRVAPHPGVPGFRAVPLASLADRLEDVCELDLLAMQDEPSSVEPQRIPFEEWLAMQWNAPNGDHDGGTAVLEGDRLVALAFFDVDLARGRAANGFAATHPDYRGRGLATLAKTRSLRWAAAHGIRRVTTENDETNAPMRAVNRRLGYEPVGRRLELELRL